MASETLRRAGFMAAAIAATVALGLALATGSGAKGKANTKVTIQGGGGTVSGTVKSSDEDNCADGRKVKIFKIKDGEKDKVGTDTAQANNNEYQWQGGNVGPGRFFAKAGETNRCQADKSKTVRSN
jgi:hypothetical protein